MWNVKANVISVILAATGTISKSLRQYLSNITGEHEIKEMQENCHIGHCTHAMESANVKVQNLFQGQNNITCSTICKYRTAATQYTLETLVCFRYIIVNTLHKGDNKDNNNNNNNGHVTTVGDTNDIKVRCYYHSDNRK